MKSDIAVNSEYRIFKIVQQKPYHLILTDGFCNMIFKRYRITFPATISALRKRQLLKHQSLIQIFKVQVQNAHEFGRLEQPNINCGILFQKYEKTLAQAAKEMPSFTEDQLFQTIKPIKEVLDYLVTQHFDPGPITLKTVVCNKEGQIKFLDGYLQEVEPKILQRPHYQTLVYQQFANFIFQLLFPRDKYIKSWKTRYQMAQKTISSQNLKWLQLVYEKFIPNLFKCQKEKKIKKIGAKNQRKSELKHEKRVKTRLYMKNLYENSKTNDITKFQQGKQNKIIQ